MLQCRAVSHKLTREMLREKNEQQWKPDWVLTCANQWVIESPGQLHHNLTVLTVVLLSAKLVGGATINIWDALQNLDLTQFFFCNTTCWLNRLLSTIQFAVRWKYWLYEFLMLYDDYMIVGSEHIFILWGNNLQRSFHAVFWCFFPTLICVIVWEKSVLVLKRLWTDWNCHSSSNTTVVSVSNVNIGTTQTVCLSAAQWECCISSRDAAKCFKLGHLGTHAYVIIKQGGAKKIIIKDYFLALGMGNVFTNETGYWIIHHSPLLLPSSSFFEVLCYVLVFFFTFPARFSFCSPQILTNRSCDYPTRPCLVLWVSAG